MQLPYNEKQMLVIESLLKSLNNTNQTLNNLGIVVKNHSVKLYQSPLSESAYLNFKSTISNGEGVKTETIYFEIDITGEQINLDAKHSKFELAEMFSKFIEITI